MKKVVRAVSLMLLMATIEKTQKTETYAVRQWMKEHQALVDSWIPIKTDFSTNSYINR